MAKKKKRTQTVDGRKIVATNRKARHDYEVVDRWECGLVLTGSEVKSLRDGQVQIKDAYAEVRSGELWLERLHISPYQFAREGGHDPERRRKEPSREEGEDEDPPTVDTPDDEGRGGSIDIKV